MSEASPRSLLVTAWDWVLWNYRRPVAEELRRRGWEIALVSPAGPYVDDLRDAGFEHIEWSVSRRGLNPLRELRAIRELASIYAAWKPDTVQHFTIKPIVHGGIAAQRTGVPGVINTFTGLGFVFSDAPVARIIRPVVTSILRWRLRDPGTVAVVLNPDDRERLVQAGVAPADRMIQITGTGVDVDRFRPGECAEVRDDELVRFLLAARLLAPKGVIEFVEAVGRLDEAGLPVEAVIAGERDPGNPQTLTEAEIASLGTRPYVRRLGQVDDVAPLLRCVDVAVLPSTSEGVPMFLLEASATGVPTVATDVPGCREAVIDGETGFLVPPGDVEDLAKALTRLATDARLRSQMGAEGRAHVLNNFVDADIARRHADVHEQLLTSRVHG